MSDTRTVWGSGGFAGSCQWLVTAFLSGLLGLGGEILHAPILLHAPQAVGLDSLPVKEIIGLTMAQGLASVVSEVVWHHSSGYVSWRLMGYMGTSVAIFALVDTVVSSNVPDGALLSVFATTTLIVSGLFLASSPSDAVEAGTTAFSAPLAASLGAVVGFHWRGLVGQVGSFILIPPIVYVLRVPTRFASGSNLGIILVATLAGLGWKFGTAQVPLFLALALVGGAAPATQVRAWVSQRPRPKLLRFLLAGVVTSAAVAIWVDIIV